MGNGLAFVDAPDAAHDRTAPVRTFHRRVDHKTLAAKPVWFALGRLVLSKMPFQRLRQRLGIVGRETTPDEELGFCPAIEVVEIEQIFGDLIGGDDAAAAPSNLPAIPPNVGFFTITRRLLISRATEVGWARGDH